MDILKEQILRAKELMGILTEQKKYGDGKTDGCVDGDCKNGYGTFITTTTGLKYVGEWKNGKPHGQGTFTWSDEQGNMRKEYVGVMDSIHGIKNGTMTYKDGTVEKWENGKLIKE
tara:strand:- start:778 stop:1122 length:345 start_codon:yes stop_codon:yes gene_type:complete